MKNVLDIDDLPHPATLGVFKGNVPLLLLFATEADARRFMAFVSDFAAECSSWSPHRAAAYRLDPDEGLRVLPPTIIAYGVTTFLDEARLASMASSLMIARGAKSGAAPTIAIGEDVGATFSVTGLPVCRAFN